MIETTAAFDPNLAVRLAQADYQAYERLCAQDNLVDLDDIDDAAWDSLQGRIRGSLEKLGLRFEAGSDEALNGEYGDEVRLLLECNPYEVRLYVPEPMRPAFLAYQAAFASEGFTVQPVPDRPRPDNRQRAYWGEMAVQAFRAACEGDRDTALGDLLANLRHWADANGQDFEYAIANSEMHYLAEVAGE